MDLTMRIRLLPDDRQEAALLAVMDRFNPAATFAAEVGFRAGAFSQPAIHKLVYRDIRQRFGLSAQLAYVDPRDTSRTCAACGHCEKANRKSQGEFSCEACGHEAHADANTARNIRALAVSKPATGLGNHPGNRVA